VGRTKLKRGGRGLNAFPGPGKAQQNPHSDEELPVLQASDGEEDNERSEQRFGYNPDKVTDNSDPWAEYQAVMEDPMHAY
jgi:hypothetical protein